jgi:hypothetical protein
VQAIERACMRQYVNGVVGNSTQALLHRVAAEASEYQAAAHQRTAGTYAPGRQENSLNDHARR